MANFLNNNYNSDDIPEMKMVYAITIDALIEIYGSISNSLKPTPAKSHYIFNQRDLCSVYEGIRMANPK
jgi:dynein heavy chain